ncbi:unnamed protein product [Effrenium voratum]|nr:unnamed protein product [Effrenium voratum]
MRCKLATLALAAICRADCSASGEVTEACSGHTGEDWFESMLPPGISPHSSLVKCIGATFAGSMFALAGMLIESRKDRREKPISREDLKLPRSTSCASPASSPAKELAGEPQEDAELKRSQSLPASQLGRTTRSSSPKEPEQSPPKARSDESDWRSSSGRLTRTASAPLKKASVPASPLSAVKGISEMQKVERQVKSILNKLTWEKFDKLYADLLTYCTVEDQQTRLETVEVIARDIFKKDRYSSLLPQLVMLAAKIIFHCIDELISIGSAEGLDQLDIYRRKAEEAAGQLRSAWEVLAKGLHALNEDDPDEAMAEAHNATSLFRSEGNAEGEMECLLLLTRALTSINRRKDADKLARDMLAEKKQKADKPSEGRCLLVMAEVNADQRGSKKREEARACSKQALDIFNQLGDERAKAAALLVQSHICIKSKNQDRDKRAAEAIALATEAQRISQELGDVRTEAACLHAIASAHDIMEQHTACMVAADEALDRYLELKDPYAEAFELCCMAQWFINYSRWQLAISHAEDALDILRRAPRPSAPQELRALQLLSQAHEGRGDKTGTKAVQESLKRFQQSNNQSAEAAAMDMLLRAHCEKGEFDKALEAAEKARSAFKAIGDVASEANTSSLIAGLYLKQGLSEEALKEGQNILELVKKSGATKQKSDLMMTIAQAHLEKQEVFQAMDICREMQEHFAERGDVEGEADALLAAGSLHVLQEDLDEARGLAVKAQLILSEEGNASGEGKALRLLAEIYAKQEQHKAAIRAGERSRALLRGEESPTEEASMLFLVAQEAVQLAVIEGARVGSDKPLKRHARDALDKAEKSAKAAMKLCKENASQTGITEILGSSMCSMSQVHMLRSNYQEALSVARNAVQLFSDEGHPRNQASANLLCADAHRAMENYSEAQKCAFEATRCFKEADPVDEKGLEAAQKVLDSLKQHLAPAPRPTYQGPTGGGGLPAQMLAGYEDEEEAPGEARVARSRPSGPALDVKNLRPELVQKKIMEVALALTGAPEDEIQIDTPLMEAGVTSTMAVGLSDELKKDLPGIRLPATLVFDYPSIAAMTELILEGD